MNPQKTSELVADRSAPTVSVIVPAFNVAGFIAETIDSVLAQTYPDYEIIVINDGSPDTAELESALQPYMRKIIYLKQCNKGAGAARNAGLRAARGEYVAFLDGDDLWLPTFLEDQLKFIRRDGGYDLVYANAEWFGDSVWLGKTYMDSDPSTGEVNLEGLLSERCLVITSGVLAKKAPIFNVGLFDESLRNSQDFDLWVRLSKHASARMNYQRKVLLRHRAHPNSLASDSIRSVEGELSVLDKVSKWTDLSGSERASLESTRALRRATVEIDRGKRLLRDGEFKAAAESFRFANAYFRSWKLWLVLISLKFFPRLLLRFYNSRRFEFPSDSTS